MLLILLRANIHIIFKKAKYLHAFLKRKYSNTSISEMSFTRLQSNEALHTFNIFYTCKTKRIKITVSESNGTFTPKIIKIHEPFQNLNVFE